MADEAKITFASEEERRAALKAIPEFPPQGTTDIDKWQADVEVQQAGIFSAPIVAKSTETPVRPPAAAVQQPTPQAPAAAAPVEDDVIQISVKRTDLPEELRKYKDGSQIVEQFGHARRYANQTEEKFRAASDELTVLRGKAQKADELEKAVTELTRARDELQTRADVARQTPIQKAETQAHIDSLSKTLEDIKDLGEDDLVPAKVMRATLSAAVSEISNTTKSLGDVQSEFKTYKEQTKRDMESLRTEVTSRFKKDEEREALKKNQERVRLAVKGLMDLQTAHKELATSKPLFDPSGNDDVEKSVFAMCNRLADKPVDIPTANRIINAYMRGDSEVKAVMMGKGMTAQDFGITDADIQNYAIMANIDARMNGFRINPGTGQREQITNVFGQPVVFRDYDSAYKDIMDELGITKEEQERRIADESKRGQQALIAAINQRDTSGKVLSGQFGGDPEKIGLEMSKEEALRIFKDQNIGDKMELAARNGDRRLFNLYNKAAKTLKQLGLTGVDEVPPESYWPAEKKVA